MTDKLYFRLDIKYFLNLKKSVIVCAIAKNKKFNGTVSFFTALVFYIAPYFIDKKNLICYNTNAKQSKYS